MRKLFIILLFLICAASAVFADGGFIPRVPTLRTREQDIKEPTQKAVIIHTGKKEKLILQTTYTGNVSEFVWIVPTPNVIKVDKADPKIFEKLHEITNPKPNPARDAQLLKGMGAGPGAAGGVDILGQKTIGVYDVTVLRSKRSDDLIHWLNTNNYEVPENIKPILDDYILRGWVFTASKINTRSYTNKNKEMTGALEPLALEFYSESPVFPLKLTAINKGITQILIYIVSNTRMETPVPIRMDGTHGDDFDTLYASPIDDKTYYSTGLDKAYYKDLQSNGNTNVWLSKCQATLGSRDMTEDVIFSASSNQAIILPSNVIYTPRPGSEYFGGVDPVSVHKGIRDNFEDAIRFVHRLPYEARESNEILILLLLIYPAFIIFFIMIVIGIVKRNRKLILITLKYFLYFILLLAGYLILRYFWMMFLNS